MNAGLDLYWAVATTPVNVTGAPPPSLTYTVATVVSSPPSGWVSAGPTANWIAHNANGSNIGSLDTFFRYRFNLDPSVDPSRLNLRLDFYVDNAVYQVWVNGVAQNIRSAFGAGDPYEFSGYYPGTQATGTMSGPWQTGLNTIVVHTKSIGPLGFLARFSSNTVCRVPELSVTKSSNAAGNLWHVGQTDAAYRLTVTNRGSAATAGRVTVRDLLPSGILPGWIGTHTVNGWECTYSGRLVACTTNQVIAAAGNPGNSSVIDLPVEITVDALGQATSYASVGGGEDPFNGGDAPVPGASCTDTYHCATHVVTVRGVPNLTVEKTVDQAQVNAPGVLHYTIRVRNTGTLPLTDVQPVDTMPDGNTVILADPDGDDGNGTLDLGESWTYTTSYSVEQGDIDAGSPLVNSVSVRTAEMPDGVAATAQTSIEQTPALALTKTGQWIDGDGNGFANEGERVEFTFTVRNTGNVTLTGVTPVDGGITVGGQPPAGSLSPFTPASATLAPGEEQTFTASYTLAEIDILGWEMENVATARGTAPDGSTVESAPSRVTVILPGEPGLALSKTGTWSDADGNGRADAGEPVTFTFTVENTGNVTLAEVRVDDSMLTIGEAPRTLRPGESFTFSVAHVLTQEEVDAGRIDNTATAHGVLPNGEPFTGESAAAAVPLPAAPGLSLTKSGAHQDANGNGRADAGEPVTFTFTVENTGNVTLAEVRVDDSMLTIGEAPRTLRPGESFTFSVAHVLTQEEVDAGRIDNTATAHGVLPNGAAFTGESAAAAVPLPAAPGLSLVKSGVYDDVNASGYADEGEILRYSFTVRNTGNVTLRNVQPVDDGPAFAGRPGMGTLSAFSPEPATLAPGAEQTFTATYTLAQEDIDVSAGVDNGITNTAEARAQAPDGTLVASAASTARITLPDPEPLAVTLVKQSLVRTIRRGEQAPFVIVARNDSSTNAGRVTITDVMPAGFRYVEGSATVNGNPAEVEVEGRRIVFSDLRLRP